MCHYSANGFQSEMRFAHAAGILFVDFKFMFLTYGISASHDITKQGMYALFSKKKKKRKKQVLGNLQIAFN